jgi:hypothetical protein
MNKLTFILILLVTLFPLTTSAGSKAGEIAGIRSKGKKEVLIARDVGGGLPYSVKLWCGNNALLIYGEEFGTQWIGLNGKKITVSAKSTDYPGGCSPDGKWVFYRDRTSSRVYKDKLGRVPENVVYDGFGWHGFVIDLYRYEVSTGRRQRFAVVRDDSSALVSPDGSKVLLGNRHDSTIEMPEPKWETVWLTNDWVYGPTYWLPDSSGIATNIWHNGFTLGVEFFGKEGWSKEFSLDLMRTRRNYGATGVILEAVDEDNILHFTARDSLSGGSAFRSKYNFFSCKIKRKDLVCSFTGGLEEEKGDSISSSEFLSNGDIIFKREEDNCIRRVKFGETVTKCIADTRFGDDIYISISLIAVSPDESRIAVRRGKMSPKPRFYAYEHDFFIIELEKD